MERAILYSSRVDDGLAEGERRGVEDTDIQQHTSTTTIIIITIIIIVVVVVVMMSCGLSPY